MVSPSQGGCTGRDDHGQGRCTPWSMVSSVRSVAVLGRWHWGVSPRTSRVLRNPSWEELLSGTRRDLLQHYPIELAVSLQSVVEKAHNADLHCVDWNPHDRNHILTGSADNSVRMFDCRKLTSGGIGSPWSPDKSSVFGSAAEDGCLNVWDHERVGKKDHALTRVPDAPPGLFFRHAGHRDKVVDFHWNTSDPWTVVSVSDDCESTGGGGTLQIWRMSDLIYRPEEEVIAELEMFKQHVSSCTPRT
ncbi:hypothetical protein Taro_036651 [Colocasia esculenta]|uniref:Uncharacterized protein n=1 Tax=Colocasia esculenta TaxID=4460 RepID=A0A843WGX2_COLES|nr:hypothetical protein [Colocasia esculenta]